MIHAKCTVQRLADTICVHPELLARIVPPSPTKNHPIRFPKNPILRTFCFVYRRTENGADDRQMWSCFRNSSDFQVNFPACSIHLQAGFFESGERNGCLQAC
jgi:hypothetical protein